MLLDWSIKLKYTSTDINLVGDLAPNTLDQKWEPETIRSDPEKYRKWYGKRNIRKIRGLLIFSRN